MPIEAVVDLPADEARVRTEIVAAMIRVLRAHPLHETTPELVATEAGLTTDGLRHTFPSWDGLLLATIDQWNAERTAPLMPIASAKGTVLFLRAIVVRNIDDPALMRFLTSMLNIAATPQHPLAPMLYSRWRKFHAFVAQALRQDVQLGREPHTMEPARGAEQLLATYEGLQLQSMVRPEMDMLESYDRAVTRMRDGWSREYVAPMWDLELAV